jgi:hypothetical protein
MARFACVVLTLWNLTMWDRVSDPVSRPNGPRARCGQSMSIAAVYLAIKKLIPLSSSPSPRIVAGNFLNSPRRCSRLLPERVLPQIQPACGGCYAHPRALDLLSCSQQGSAYTLPEVINAIKGPAARRINALLNGKGPVWQEEFFDHVLRSNEVQRQAPTTGSCTEWSMSARIRWG